MIPESMMQAATKNLARFRSEWSDEVPMKIHESGLDASGVPRWSGEFARWLGRGTRKRPEEDAPDTQLRLTRAMRTLRKVAPREHDVLWRVLRGESTSEVCDWLNHRAESMGHPERFTLKDTTVLIISGLDKVSFWY